MGHGLEHGVDGLLERHQKPRHGVGGHSDRPTRLIAGGRAESPTRGTQHVAVTHTDEARPGVEHVGRGENTLGTAFDMPITLTGLHACRCRLMPTTVSTGSFNSPIARTMFAAPTQLVSTAVQGSTRRPAPASRGGVEHDVGRAHGAGDIAIRRTSRSETRVPVRSCGR